MEKFIKSILRSTLRPVVTVVWQHSLGPLKIHSYLKDRRPGEELRVIFGGHSRKEEKGWLVLDERDQDITKPLHFADGSVDAVYTEHVVEHLPLPGAIFFFKEAKRILKKGSTMRTVCPMFEKMFAFDEKDPRVDAYISEGVIPQFMPEEKALSELGLSARQFPKSFFFNNLYLRHGHVFIWSASLMKEVLLSLGFRDVEIKQVGEGKNALERRIKGIIRADGVTEYEPESLVLEAVK